MGYNVGVGGPAAVSPWVHPPPELPWVHQPGSAQNPFSWGLYIGFITWARLTHTLLQPLFPPQRSGVRLKVPTLSSGSWCSWQEGPVLGVFQSHLVNTNSGGVERGLFWTTKDALSTFIFSELFQEPGKKKYVYIYFYIYRKAQMFLFLSFRKLQRV